MRTILCSEERHAGAILEIFNDTILNSTAIYDYKPRPREWVASWFAAKRTASLPVVGVEDASGRLLGFGSFGAFRAWPAYHYTVEHSIYVEKDYRGRGIGRALLEELIDQARLQNKHVMVGGIDTGNAASIALHLSLGFVHAGTIRHAGFKFGRWLDLAFYQRILDTPAVPTENQ
jgi:phosphinothricin acetyltransferase